MAQKPFRQTAPTIQTFTATENQCIWMRAGIVNFKLCENAYDCLTCPFDKLMARDVKKRQGRVAPLGKTLAGKPYHQKECRHMLTGRVPYHFCSNSYQCHVCEFDQSVDEMDFAEVKGSIPTHRIAGFQAADSYYYHRGHSWARVEHDGLVRIGIDDFALRLIGRPTGINLPLPGSRLEQTEVGWTVMREERTARMLAPVSGVILAANQRVINHPETAKEDPYSNGWLLVIEPHHLRRNLKNLLFEEEAEAWLKADSQKLGVMITNAYGLPLAATGGEIVDDIYGNVANKIGWDELVYEFLLT